MKTTDVGLELILVKYEGGSPMFMSADGPWVESAQDAHVWTDVGEAERLIRNFAISGVEVDAVAGWGEIVEHTFIAGADMADFSNR